ncbi:McrC family protein [Nocardia tengchongensis]|uniref:McrC family protein n=1 Tax=Nocardia tengchongensis TaxID=2055889 RepID=UPI0036BA8A4C
MAESLRLFEYQTISVPYETLTDDDLRRLRALEAQRRFTVSADRSGWRLTAGATVGILALDHFRLIIEPKIAFPDDTLLTWLCYASQTPVPHQSSIRRWRVEENGFADLVAAALAVECRTLLRDGLRRDYLPRDVVAPVLRGRLDVMAQATKRFGMVDRLHAHTHERDPRVWENEICGSALRIAHTKVGNPHLACELASLAVEFPSTSPLSTVRRQLNRARYTRLNDRYRTAHTWAGLLLRDGGVADLLVDEGLTAESLLLDMPRLWESVVHRLLRDAGPPGSAIVSSAGAAGITAFGDVRSRPPFRPDALLRLRADNGEQTYFPADAKYKRYDSKAVSSGDVHQLLTYIAGYASEESPTAAILYPSPKAHSHRELRIAGNGRGLGAIHVLGIDTGSPPAEAARHIRDTLWPAGR